MRKYYEHKESGQALTLYSKISNGVILTHFDKKTGVAFGNDSYQNFVTAEQLKENWKEFNFKLDSSEAMNRIISSNLSDIVYQLQNYGIAENLVNVFNEFKGSTPVSCSVYFDMVKDDKAEFKDFLSNYDDEFEFSEAEDLFNFLHGGLVPILKKMLIELKDAQ